MQDVRIWVKTIFTYIYYVVLPHNIFMVNKFMRHPIKNRLSSLESWCCCSVILFLIFRNSSTSPSTAARGQLRWPLVGACLTLAPSTAVTTWTLSPPPPPTTTTTTATTTAAAAGWWLWAGAGAASPPSSRCRRGISCCVRAAAAAARAADAWKTADWMSRRTWCILGR